MAAVRKILIVVQIAIIVSFVSMHQILQRQESVRALITIPSVTKIQIVRVAIAKSHPVHLARARIV